MSQNAAALAPDAAFEELVRANRRLMMAAVWRVTRDADLAEDALQDALTILWRKLPVVLRHPNPRALMVRICLDRACDLLRARLRRERRDAPLEEAGAAAVDSPAGAAESRAAVHDVLAAIGRLRRKQAVAVMMRVLHEEEYPEIARALGCSEATARVHVLRGRMKLKRWLAHLAVPGRTEETR